MKGLAKVIKRTPHMVSSKVGLAAKSTDVEFDHMRNKFQAMAKLIRQLAKESTTYLDSVKSASPLCSTNRQKCSFLRRRLRKTLVRCSTRSETSTILSDVTQRLCRR